LAKICEGYSGSDIFLICRDAAMMPMRRQISNKSTEEILEMKSKGELKFTLTMDDFKEAISHTQPSVGPNDHKMYEKWMKEFGSN
jgi:katanin p60 ATPase-containing subunit A1